MRSIILLSTGECSLREACCCSCGEDVLWYGGSELTWYHHQHHRLQHWTVALIILSNFHLLSWIRSFFVFSVCLSLLQLNPLLYLQFPCLTCNDIWDAALLLLTLAKKRIRRRKKDKENYLLLSNCYCLLTSTPHPPTCIHMLLLRRERKQKKKRGLVFSAFVFSCLYIDLLTMRAPVSTGKDSKAREVTLLKKMMLSFISIHILLVFLFFIFLLSLPHPSLFQMKHWKGKQQSETNVTSSSSCSFFLSICHPILPAIGTARECQMLSGVKTITTTPFRSPTVGPIRNLFVCVSVHWTLETRQAEVERSTDMSKRQKTWASHGQYYTTHQHSNVRTRSVQRLDPSTTKEQKK